MSRTSRSPFLGSLSIHVVVLLILIAVRDSGETPQAADTAPRTSARLVFMPTQGAGGGGGGGGELQPEPARRVKAKGMDHVSAPVQPPPIPSSKPATPIEDVLVPLPAIVPTAAATQLVAGLIDPQAPQLGALGPGGPDGAGNGTRGGNGSGEGVGVGPGSQKGINGGPYESGNGVTAPVPVRQARPQYTTAAMSARLAGSVLVECVVMPDGTVDHVRVVRSLDPRLGLDEEAVKAARQWRFRPGTLHGEPVPVRVTIELSFSIY